MPQHKLLPAEIAFLEQALNSGRKEANLRLREGEHQFGLAKAVAAFELELHFPDVKEIIVKLYGQEKADDLQFVRKIQTVLKKMEKSNIVKILPKKMPWELQRYGLASFVFEDSDRSTVTLASREQLQKMQEMLQSISGQKGAAIRRLPKRILLLSLVGISYVVMVWSSFQPIINPYVFIPALSISLLFSIALGKNLSRV